MSIRIYVACLASYNNGVLHGAWIDASSDVDEMQAQVLAMLRNSEFPNVTVECPLCRGKGETTFGNSETGEFRQDTCPTCIGKGRVPSAEEYAIHDFEGLPRSFGEFSGLQKVADFVELVEEFDHIEDSDMAEILEEFGDISDARGALNDGFCGIFDSFRDYADEFADEMIACEITDSGRRNGDSLIERYFDYESFARDLQMDMRTVCLSGGRLAVFHA